MPNPTPGRNDPCPCGSGKKYKNCCLGKDRARQLRSTSWRNEEQETLEKLLAFAQRPTFTAQITVAFNLFWNGTYGLSALRMIDQGESARFLDWYMFDYRLEGGSQRIIDLFAGDETIHLSTVEHERVRAWRDSYTSLYRRAGQVNQSVFQVEDLLQNNTIEVMDTGFGHLGLAGDVIIGRLLRSSSPPHLSWAAVLLPADMADPLTSFAREGYRQYRETHSLASWPEFLSNSGYIFNHYLLKAAAEARQPRVGKHAYYDAFATLSRLSQAESELREERARRASLMHQERGKKPTEEPAIRQTKGGLLLPGNVSYKGSQGRGR